jgi:hypothetical protein
LSDDSEIVWTAPCSIGHCKRFKEEIGKGDTSSLTTKMRRDRVGNCGNCDVVHVGRKLAGLRAKREKREQSEWANSRSNARIED